MKTSESLDDDRQTLLDSAWAEFEKADPIISKVVSDKTKLQQALEVLVLRLQQLEMAAGVPASEAWPKGVWSCLNVLWPEYEFACYDDDDGLENVERLNQALKAIEYGRRRKKPAKKPAAKAARSRAGTAAKPTKRKPARQRMAGAAKPVKATKQGPAKVARPAKTRPARKQGAAKSARTVKQRSGKAAKPTKKQPRKRATATRATENKARGKSLRTSS